MWHLILWFVALGFAVYVAMMLFNLAVAVVVWLVVGLGYLGREAYRLFLRLASFRRHRAADGPPGT
jgi:hypothetical protein